MLRLTSVVLAFALFFIAPAYATYMSISASDATGDRAVRCDEWIDGDVVWLPVFGDVPFNIVVSRNSQKVIDTCWIYLNGTTTFGAVRTFTATDFRLHHGIAIIKYTDSTYESVEFRVKPSWPLGTTLQTPVYAPNANATAITDLTAGSLIDSVVSTDSDSDRPAQHYVCVDGEGCMYKMDPGPDECRTDLDCD